MYVGYILFHMHALTLAGEHELSLVFAASVTANDPTCESVAIVLDCTSIPLNISPELPERVTA